MYVKPNYSNPPALLAKLLAASLYTVRANNQSYPLKDSGYNFFKPDIGQEFLWH